MKSLKYYLETGLEEFWQPTHIKCVIKKIEPKFST